MNSSDLIQSPRDLGQFRVGLGELSREVGQVFDECVEAHPSVFDNGQLLHWAGATRVLVEMLLTRGSESDVQEAAAAIERLAVAPADDSTVIREIWLLGLRAFLAKALGDEATFRDYRDRYHDMATSLGFEGHMKWAEAMP